VIGVSFPTKLPETYATIIRTYSCMMSDKVEIFLHPRVKGR